MLRFFFDYFCPHLKAPIIIASSHTDTVLIQRWQSGEESAFKEFFKLHFQTLLNIALRKVGQIQVAEELVQDTFMDFYQSREKIKDTPLAYLRIILRNKIYDYYHKQKTNPIITLPPEENINITVNPTVVDGLHEREINQLLDHQIALLPEQCRHVFLLRRQEELSNKEIAARLGISVKTVEGHITKAIKYLRLHMDRHWSWYPLIMLLAREIYRGIL